MAGAALYGCGSVPTVLATQAEPAPRHAALTAALKDVLCAQYDHVLVKHKASLSKLPPLEQNKERIAQYWRTAEARIADNVIEPRRRILEDRLREAKLPADAMADIAKFRDCEALESYYLQEGLYFHSSDAFTLPGYELLRLSPAERRTVTLFGTERAVSVRSVDEVLIPHASQYAAEHGLPSNVLGGQYWANTKNIVLRPGILRLMSDSIFEIYEKELLPEGDALFDPKRLEQHLHSAPLPTDFWMTLGRQLRYQAVHGESGDKKQAMHDAFSKNIVLHEAMHAVDDENFDFIKESKYAADLITIRRSHAELRAYLASMIDGHSRHALADTLRSAVFGVHKEAHTVAAQMFMDRLVKQVVANRKQYPEIDLSMNLASHVLSQLPKLSDAQIRQTAQGIFDATYRGRSLREYVLDFTK